MSQSLPGAYHNETRKKLMTIDPEVIDCEAHSVFRRVKQLVIEALITA